jgi:hypothetical protein
MKASLILISLALALSATAQQRGANRGFGRGRGRGRFNQAKGGKGGNQVATTKAATATAVAGGTTVRFLDLTRN